MPLLFGMPDTSLQPYINTYVLYDQEEATTVQNVTVTGYQFLWSVLQGELVVNHPVKGVFNIPPIAMMGHFTNACTVQQVFPCRVAAISFKPLGCHALFGFSMQTFRDYFTDISHPRLYHTLQSAKDIDAIGKAFDEWLLQILHNGLHDVTGMRQIIAAIEERHGNITVEDILKQFFLTERTLQRWFNKTMGINPKIYLRIVRFNYVLNQLNRENFLLEQIITTAGYFDQSHFIKDFLRFTGCNPSVFKRHAGTEMSRETLKGILESIQTL